MLFIFDVNTPYKHSNVLANNTFVFEEDNVFVCWDNCFDEENQLTSINLDFFVNEGNNLYKRYSDYIEERAYSDIELKSALCDAGFEILDVLEELKFTSPKNDTERVFYITRKAVRLPYFLDIKYNSTKYSG